MRTLSAFMAMAALMGGGIGIPVTSRPTRTNRGLSHINENTSPDQIIIWFLNLDADQQKRIVDMQWERKENENANDFLTRRNIMRSVQHFIKKNPDHPQLIYKKIV